ncbi:MAG: hypothetical protein WCP55_09170 [Lentisphaerota bacterium]
MDFKNFIFENEKNMKDTRSTLSNIPKKHSALIKGYKFIFQPDNTLKKYKNHVGIIDDDKKTITIAAPYNYGREFVLLHELGHIVWKKFVSSDLQKKWHKIAKPYLEKLNDTSEEIFCMIYANNHCKNKISKFEIPELNQFVNKIT